MALLLCLITTPLLLILSIFLLDVRIRASELDIDRALSYQVQTRLAGFNKPLYEEFGLLALNAPERAVNFQRLLPEHLQHLSVKQKTSQSLTDPVILRQSILTFMRLRLPASVIKTLTEQMGIRITSVKNASFSYPSAPASFVKANYFTRIHEIQSAESFTIPKYSPDVLQNGFSEMVRSAIGTLLSEAVYGLLDEEIKGMLIQYQRFVAECVTIGEGDEQQLTTYPDIFNPQQISKFTDVISRSMTLPNYEIYNRLAVREYIIATFWPAGKPSRSNTTTPAGMLKTDEQLAHRNFSGTPFKQYQGRMPGEVEQILSGAQTAQSGIDQVKAVLVIYRAANHLLREIANTTEMANYRMAAATLAGIIVTVSGGTVVIDPEVIAYLLLACDAIRQGFTDYTMLMNGERLAFTNIGDNNTLMFDYVMHLRVLLLLTPEKNLLKNVSALVTKRYPGIIDTRIDVNCQFRGQTRTQQGSLLTIGSPA
jgi:hypothetical protein